MSIIRPPITGDMPLDAWMDQVTKRVALASQTADAVATVQALTSGVNPVNAVTLVLYKRYTANTLPVTEEVLVDTIYEYSTTTLTNSDTDSTVDFSGWSRSLPDISNGDYLYACQVNIADTAPTETIAATDWSTPVLIASANTEGLDGFNNATVTLYKRTDTETPIVPDNPLGTLTYNFATSSYVRTINTDGWTDINNISEGKYLWIATAGATSRGPNYDITTTEWNVTGLSVNGTDADVYKYVYKDNLTKPISKPSDNDATGWLLSIPSSVNNTLWLSIGVQSGGVGDFTWSEVVQVSAKDGLSALLFEWQGSVAWPTFTTRDNAYDFTFESAFSGNVIIRINATDAEGDVYAAFNGELLGPMSGPDTAVRWYEFSADNLLVGTNTISLWSVDADSGTINEVKVAFVGAQGTPGTSAPRYSTFRLWYDGDGTAPSSPLATITWSTGLLSAMSTGWSLDAPTVDANGSNVAWFSDVQFSDTTGVALTAIGTGTTPKRQITFEGIVKFVGEGEISDGTTSQTFGTLASANTVDLGTEVTGILGLTNADDGLKNSNVSYISLGDVPTAVLPNVAEAINTNTTTIDGAKITTGSIEAAQISVGSLTADRLVIDGLTIDSNASGQLVIKSEGVSETQLAGSAVSTVKVQDNAINVISKATAASGNIVGTQGTSVSADIVTLTVTTTGAPLTILAQARFSGTSSFSNALCFLYRDGVFVTSMASISFPAYSNVVEHLFVDDQPDAGTHTYTLRLSTNSNGGTLYYDGIYFQITETKK